MRGVKKQHTTVSHLHLTHSIFIYNLKVIFGRLYSTTAANDHCTLFANRNLINRCNVAADPTKAHAPDKQMLLLAVKSRLVAATMMELGMDTISGEPTKNLFQKGNIFF